MCVMCSFVVCDFCGCFESIKLCLNCIVLHHSWGMGRDCFGSDVFPLTDSRVEFPDYWVVSGRGIYIWVYVYIYLGHVLGAPGWRKSPTAGCR